MPVKLEHIRTPNDADWIDIEKIHKDTASQQGLTSTPMEVSSRLAAGDWIVAARFNDRVIGLILAHQQDNQVWIDQAAVRTITQRRGVMHQTLFLLMKWAREQSLTLICQNVPVQLQTALSRRGFQQQGEQWICNPAD
ncbi:acetyl-CoA sensor PanZ family protein [Parathalassolituus penaei]|uniref:Acetyl-CoA sensor PanZ family protein n=1 Tax=Parathalassolituus penaei TaxID=2997323 RepID=A0A9X3ITX7_9GAMM|nr:acetyl-CoA sensor PanZ family protein [Parathalassolituus penaei]MCY0967341.1 acetyl-CoA sensor PanZ family protein [Parathalassolituus penaei]